MSLKSIVSHYSIKRSTKHVREQKKKPQRIKPTKANVESYQKGL
ncbi:hypothetical protein IGK47_001781 [Enterococcus sp. AZ007]